VLLHKNGDATGNTDACLPDTMYTGKQIITHGKMKSARTIIIPAGEFAFDRRGNDADKTTLNEKKSA